jgi:Ser/Thr protein kinase RdoA (MazF antagonist)
VDLAWSRPAGCRGLPEVIRDLPRGPGGRVKGEQAAGGDEPAAGLAAWERGRRAHHEARYGEAERHYRVALAWVPDSDAVRYGLGCVALERKDPQAALRWWQEAVEREPGADRARVDGAVLALAMGAPATADELLAPMAERAGKVGDAVSGARQALAEAQPATAVERLQALVGASPAMRWYGRPEQAARPPAELAEKADLIAQLTDESWVAEERADLERVLQERSSETWVWHAAIARAITIGAMDLAALAEQRLHRVAPEHRLWGIELRQLDLTGQAFEALARTRRHGVGAIKALRWVAIGAHGPTAMLVCEGGTFYAKRYVGAGRPAASVAFTHRACRTLLERGLRVPVPFGDRDGDDVMVFGDDLLALYPDLGGRSIRDEDIGADDAAQVAALLAHIHLQSSDLSSRGGRPAGGIRVGTRVLRHRSPAAAWQLHMARDADCAKHFDNHPLRTRLESLLAATGRRLAGVVERCPTVLVHGDFGPGNVLRGPEDGVWGVVDWDLCDVDLAVWDLARAIDRLSVYWATEPGRPAEIRAAVASAMLRAYNAERALNAHERAALPILIAASRVDLDASVLPMCVALEPDAAEPVLAAMLARLSRAAAGAPEVADALAGD